MRLTNECLTLEFDPRNGSLIRFEFHGAPLVKDVGEGTLFHFLLRDADGAGHPLGNTDFPAPAVTVERCGAQQFLLMRFADAPAMPELTVRVAVRLADGDAMSHWRISFSGLSGGWYSDWVDFPRVRVPNDLVGAGGRARFFWPGSEGVEFDCLHIREASGFKSSILDYPLTGVGGYYPGPCPMQFQAYYRPEAGLYLATHDATHAPKGIDVACDEGDTIRPWFQLFTGSMFANAYELPFEVTVGGFYGDWQDAAIFYRSWMEGHDPFLPPKLAGNPDTPGWLKDSPVVLIYPVKGAGFDTGSLEGNEYFPYVNAMPMVEKYAKVWNAPILTLLMHWEGTAPWAPPYVWPPFGGEEALSEFARALHARGHRLGVYASGTAWTQTSSIDPSYSRAEQFEREGLAKEMCRGPRGEMFARVCNGDPPGTGQRIGYEMCVARDWSRGIVAAEIAKIAGAEVDYLQFFDQNQGCSAPLCYERGHGHPPAPGPWLTEAMSTLLDASARAIHRAGSRAILGCENGAAQPYIRHLPLNDLRNHLAWRYARPVPAYAMLFHEYVNNFMGNGVCLCDWFDRHKSAEFIQYRTAYSFVSGDLLSAVMKGGGEMHWSWTVGWDEPGPAQEPLTELMGTLNAWRRGRGRDFLVFGRMEKDLPVACGTWPLHFLNEHPALDLPSVLSSHWTNGGREAEILVNFRGWRPERATVVFGAERTGRWYAAPAAAAAGTPFAGDALTLDVPPLSAVAIEFDEID